jgi:hypothetical protein
MRAIADAVNSAVADPPGDALAARPDSGLDLPLHAKLSQVSAHSAALPAAVAGDDLEAEVAELIQAMQKSGSPIGSDRSSAVSVLSSLPSSNSRGSIDRALLLSVVGPACSVSQTALASSTPPPAAHDVERGDVSAGSAVESSAALVATSSALAAPAMAALVAASGIAPSVPSARLPAPRNALVFKWMLWTGSAYEPFSDAAHDLIEKSLRAF